MFKYLGKTIFSLLCILPVASQAQEKDWRPSSVRIGTDVYGLARTAFRDGFRRQEFQADIDFYKYFVVVDAGRENIDHSGEGYTHTSEGSYLRLGVDVNFTPYNANRDVVFLGVRYAHSAFSEQLNFGYAVPYWGASGISAANTDISSKWMEGVIGIKVRVWQQLYMGYTIRAKFFNSIKGAGSLVPYEVPGYGLTEGGAKFGFGYHVYYRLAFRDKAIPLKPDNDN